MPQFKPVKFVDEFNDILIFLTFLVKFVILQHPLATMLNDSFCSAMR